MSSYNSEIFLYTFQGLFYNHFNEIIETFTPVSPGASVRKIFRLESGEYKAIGIFNENIYENMAFIGFANTFRENGINVPEIYNVSEDKTCYLIQDLGIVTLKNELQKANETQQINLSVNALKELHHIQVKLSNEIDYSLCYQTSEFNSEVVDSDISKFRMYYPQLGKKLELNLDKLLNLFNDTLNELNNDYFLYRDFQSRNIMLVENQFYFIDFQSGRKGPLFYDAASFIFSGSINFEDEVKDILVKEYYRIVQSEIDPEKFNRHFYSLALLRLLQMLGSYSFSFIESNKDWVLPKFETVYKNLEFIINRSDNDEITEVCNAILMCQKK